MSSELRNALAVLATAETYWPWLTHGTPERVAAQGTSCSMLQPWGVDDGPGRRLGALVVLVKDPIVVIVGDGPFSRPLNSSAKSESKPVLSGVTLALPRFQTLRLLLCEKPVRRSVMRET